MSKIIIFGATGSVGTYTALDLHNRGFEVIAVGRRGSDNGFFAQYDIPYYSVNIHKRESFDKLPINNIGQVLHFAGAMPSKMSGYNPQSYIDSIVTGTYNVLEYARNVGAQKIIFTQTRADSNHLMGGTAPIPSDIQRSYPKKGDHAIYTICKNTAVDLIDHYFHEYDLKRFILRLPTIYAWHPGKYFYVNGQKRMKAYRYLMEQAMKGESIEIWGDPSKQKEIVYVKDLVQIIRSAIQSTSEGGFYNVGNGFGISLEEQIKGIIEVFSPENNKSKIVYRKDKPDARQFIHDISKTIDELGYKPAYTYLEMLSDFKKEMDVNRFKLLWGNVE